MFTSLWAWVLHELEAILHAGWPFFWWIRPTWSFNEIPDQSGKIFLVTGGNSGIGLTIARELYNKGGTIYIACRDEAKANEVIELIKSDEPTEAEATSNRVFGRRWHMAKQHGSVTFIHLDLADLHSVEKCARDFMKQEKRLDVLYANAGVMASPEGLRTKQGYTLQFGTNVIGHHLLIKLLLPMTKRVIITSSTGHSMAPSGGVDYPSITDPKKERYRWVEYGQSKWGNIATAEHLAWKEGVTAIAVHPGVVSTNLTRHIPIMPFVLKHAPWILRAILLPTQEGASDLLRVGTLSDSEARELSGKYIIPYGKIGRPRPDVLDLDRVEQFWEWCEEQVKRHA